MMIESHSLLTAKPPRMHKIFIDGQTGTTGLQIKGRLSDRTDIEIIEIDFSERKDSDAKQSIIDQSDLVILCLPDDAAKDVIKNTKNSHTRFIDASTAHRLNPNWSYGMPELTPFQREEILSARYVSNPGCYPTGFLTAVTPLITAGVLPANAAISINAISGFSGGGRQLIEKYETSDKSHPVIPYSLTLQHKHVPEMTKYSGLSTRPIFIPNVGNFYQGMLVSVPIHRSQLVNNASVTEVHKIISDRYKEERCIKVIPLNDEEQLTDGFLDPEGANETNRIDLFVYGHEEHILLIARLDNLGKGAAGAAVQNLNIMLRIKELESLSV